MGAISQSAAGEMLETPCIRRYSSMSHPRYRVAWAVKIRPVRTISRKGQASSSGPSASSTVKGASRSRWCATPGVGSAGRSSTSSPSPRPRPSRPALDQLLELFGCGCIIENTRHDNHRHPLLRFSVKRRADLVRVVVPFFEEHPLITAKRADFEQFASVLQMMEGRAPARGRPSAHRSGDRADEPTRAVSIPGILRGHTPATSCRQRREDMVLAPWRHGGSLERNSLSGKFRPARMA